MKHIAIAIERFRTHTRRMHLGIIRFAGENHHDDWKLRVLEFEDLFNARKLKGIDGFIVRIFNKRIAEHLRALNKPVVDVYNGLTHDWAATVDEKRRDLGIIAARHFIERRFRNFAFCGLNGIGFSDGPRESFVRFLQLAHFRCDVYKTPKCTLREFEQCILFQDRIKPPADARELRNWLKRLEKPVAIFCAHDSRAYQLIETCHSLGLRIPDEVAILGVDDDELICPYTDPNLSSIDNNGIGIGFAAAQTLATMFKTGKIPPPVFIPPIGIIARDSTRFCPMDPPWLGQALTFIRTNFNQNISAADVYSHVGKSHTLVDTAFRQKLGTSLQKEIIRTRLHEAQRLLITTKLPVGEISHRSGFRSPQGFWRSFTTTFNISPTDFRSTRPKASTYTT